MKEQQQKEKNPVYQVVRPYIYEGTVACVLDYILLYSVSVSQFADAYLLW